MNEIDATDEILVSQLAIARQSIEDRNQRIGDLLLRVELLEGMLNRLAAQRTGVPAPQAQPAGEFQNNTRCGRVSAGGIYMELTGLPTMRRWLSGDMPLRRYCSA